MSGGLEQLSTSAGKLASQLRKTFNTVSTGYKKFKDMDESIRGSGTSFSDYIRWTSKSEDATEAFGLATAYTKLRVVALNMALSAGIGLVVSYFSKKIIEAAQRVDKLAESSKEAADAATSTTSSLSELVDEYEKLGKKSDWDADDMEQAQKIQDEILQLAKEQGTLDEDHASKIDLQNGKYEEQLGLLQDITAEQLEASRYELTQNKDAQSDKLVDTAKKNNRTHYLTVWSAPEMDMGDQIKDAGIDVFNKFGGYGPDKLNDADSIVDYYNEVGKALKYIIDNTTEAERAAGGTYHSLYQFLLDEQSALRDDVDSYNDSTDAINNNTNARRKLQAVDFWSDGKSNGMDVSFTFDKVNSAVQTLEDTIDGFDASKLNELLLGTNEGLSDEQAQALANLRKALTDMDFSADTDGVNAFIQALVQVGIVAQSSANGVDAVAQASQKMEDISSKIDEIQTAYKNATTAIEEYNKYGYLSADTLQTLLNEDFEYLSCLELVDGQLQVNTEKYQGMIAAQYQSAAMALVEKANAELAKIAQGEKKDAVEDATKATEDQATALTERVCPALGEFAKASMTAAAAQEFLANGDAAWSVDPERTKEVYAGLASGLDILDATVNQIMGNSDKFRQHMNGFDKETKKRNKNTTKSVTDVASAFDTLNKAMKEYNQYGYLCADTAKSLVSLDDKFTACLTKQGDKLQINVAQFRKFVKAQLEEANAANDGGKSAAEMNKILSYLNENVDSETISFEQLTDAIKGYGTAMDEAKEKTDAIKSAFSSLSEVSKNKIENPFGALDADGVDKQYQAIRDLYDNTDLFTNEKYVGALNIDSGTIDYNSDAFKQMFLASLDKMASAARKTGGVAGEYLAQGFESAKEEIAGNIISVEEYINGLGSTLENINNRMDNFQSAFNDLSDISEEYNTYGDLSQDSIQKLMGLDAKYIACLDLQGDKLVFNKEAFRALYVEELKELALKYEGTEIGKRYAEILQKVADGTWDVTDHMKGMGTETEKITSLFSDLKDIFSSLLSLFEKFNSDKDSDLKLWGEAMIEDIDKRIDALNEQKEALEKANDEEERAITLAKLQAELEKARTQRSVRKLTSNGYEWVADESAVKEAQDNLNDQQREWNQKDAEEAIDNQIDKLNELKDKYSEIINLIGTDLDDYNKKLKYASEIAGMTFTEMEGRVDSFKSSVLGSLNAVKSVSSVKNIISSLESLINTLEKVNNVFEWAQNGFKDYQDKGLQGLFNTVKKFFSKDGSKTNIGNLFEQGWNAIANGAKSLFSGNGENSLTTIFTKGLSGIGDLVSKAFSGFGKMVSSGGSGIISEAGKALSSIGSALGIGGAAALTSVPTMTAANTAGLTGLSSVIASNGIAAGAAGTGTAIAGGTALAGGVSIPVVGTIIAGVALGINSAVKNIHRQKEIWSSDDNTGTKIVKSVGSFLWHASPFGMVVDAIDTVGGWVKKIFGIQEKKSKKDNNESNGANGKININDIVINSPDKPASATKETQQQQTDTRSPWKRFWDNFWGSKFWFWNWGKKASGSKYIEESAPYNVDEQGPELIVRKPESGRYTYLETGDGVVPSDITSKLFEMGGNPDKWFNDQLSKHTALSNIQNHTVEGNISVGDIYIQNPVGDTDVLAKEIIRDLPIKLRQERGRR